MLRLSFLMLFRLVEVFTIALLFWLLQLWEQAVLRSAGSDLMRPSRAIRPPTRIPIGREEQSRI